MPVVPGYPRATPGRPRAALLRLPIGVAAVLAVLALQVMAQTPSGAAPVPTIISAQQLTCQPEAMAQARGDVQVQRGALELRADALDYLVPQDRATATGRVSVSREGVRYRGKRLELEIERFVGSFWELHFDFDRTGTGGQAQRIDFLGQRRLAAHEVTYTGCDRQGPREPAWTLQAQRIDIDWDRQEGVAHAAQLRFLGHTILAWPRLSFPTSDARKSGWLPPQVNLDSRSGLDLAVPYYWNWAANRDMTFTPRLATRRGAGMDAELRYLEPTWSGQWLAQWLPADQVASRSRHALRMQHEGTWAWSHHPQAAAYYELHSERVSDDDWWKDFPRTTAAFTPRLLPLRAQLEQRFSLGAAQAAVYARALTWQLLQSAEAPLTAPYQRSPQVGMQLQWQDASWDIALESEVNRFSLPGQRGGRPDGQPTGLRWHAVGHIARPWRSSAGFVVPRWSFNVAAYDLDNPLRPSESERSSRAIPTFSVDAGLVLDRPTQWFGRAWLQTLEPRLLYVQTPYRTQDSRLMFDAAGRDFSVSSLFSTNAFSGVDRVSDAHHLDMGLTSRLIEERSGAEWLRLGLVQRLQFADQLITPEGTPFTRRFSDLMLTGSTSVVSSWNLDAIIRYNADIQRPVRTVLSTRYTPGDYRTISLTYRYVRNASEQVELGWQWPITRLGPDPLSPGSASVPTGCQGRLYGVGRIHYSAAERRITDSLAGLEFDAGCWIARIVAERLSTGRAEATTRLMLQLELVGLSRLGSNPLRVLKDNIPGYQLLRADRAGQPDRE